MTGGTLRCKSKQTDMATFVAHVNVRIIMAIQFDSLYYFCFVSSGGVRLSPLYMSATIFGLLYQPRVIDD
jgi:hypothetical protein